MKCEWRIDQDDMSLGQRKILIPWQESNLWPPEKPVRTLSPELCELVENYVI